MPFLQIGMIPLPVAIASRILVGGLVGKPMLRKDVEPEAAVVNAFLTSACDVVFCGSLAVILHFFVK